MPSVMLCVQTIKPGRFFRHSFLQIFRYDLLVAFILAIRLYSAISGCKSALLVPRMIFFSKCHTASYKEGAIIVTQVCRAVNGSAEFSDPTAFRRPDGGGVKEKDDER